MKNQAVVGVPVAVATRPWNIGFRFDARGYLVDVNTSSAMFCGSSGCVPFTGNARVQGEGAGSPLIKL